MKLGTQSYSLIETTLKEAVGKFASDNRQTVITDIHIQPRQDTGELCVFDDDDELLASTVIEEWVEDESEDFYNHTERILRSTLNKLKEEKCLEELSILKPYSFVMIDDERETVAELTLVDDDTMLLNDELLKDLDEELDAFLKELLED